jgi:hypothetical protein
MKWVVKYFDKKDEFYRGELGPTSIDINILKKRYEVSDGDPMYDSYPVYPSDCEFLSGIFDSKFQFDKYDYFLERYLDKHDFE